MVDLFSRVNLTDVRDTTMTTTTTTMATTTATTATNTPSQEEDEERENTSYAGYVVVTDVEVLCDGTRSSIICIMSFNQIASI